MEAILAILGLLVIGGAVYWLAGITAKDRQRMAEVLGLRVVKNGPQETGQDYIMGHLHQTLAMEGEMCGYPAGVWLRSVRRFTKMNSKNQSLQTVLAFSLPGESRVDFRVAPAMTGKMQSWFGGDQPAVPSGDAGFDKLFRLTSQEPDAARRILTGEMKELLVAFRERVVGEMPDSQLGQFSGDLLMGTFAIEGTRATYTVSGTASEKIARHFAIASQFLAEFARRARETA